MSTVRETQQQTFSRRCTILAGDAFFVLSFLRYARLRQGRHTNRSFMQIFLSFPWSGRVQDARRHKILYFVGDHVVDHRLCDAFQMTIEFIYSQCIVG